MENTTISETAFIQTLKENNQQAFALLYDKYGPAMLGIINKLVNNIDEAESLLQDAFIKVWKNISSYDATKGRLFTWLITISRNTALNFLRSHENIRKIEIQNVLESVSTRRLISEPVSTDHIGINKIVGKLDEKHSVIINLIYFWGFTQQEVSEKLNLPLGTVKSRTRAALQILKEQLHR